ncbi:MAG: sugar kinase [Pseudomonadota bacterium]|uniref:sugar kinase n=1 Tax=Phenylobacterium sp. TaxID=1871053 RepID=UPI0025EBD5F7|nr:sugar kinase [Phenylobacterium sp.]MBT9470571.1 sugar kinase [Phenylobacterium sp.]
MTRAICIGECMVELREAQGGLYRRGYAGDTYNTAVYLKRSAPDLDVQFATATGDDPLSQSMREAWRAEGVGDDLAFQTPGKRPGLYLIETDPHGERRFQYWRGESAARNWLQELSAAGGLARLAGADLVYLSGISLAILAPADRARALDLLHALRGQVGLIAFDPNLRPALWPSLSVAREVFEEAVGVADILLPSRQDLELLYDVDEPGLQMMLLLDRGAREVALTAEDTGCLVRHAETMTHIDAIKVEAVIDTSGAGDSFNGAYLAARLQGHGPLAAARAGLALAAQVVAHPGAVVPKSSLHYGNSSHA